MRCSAGLDLHAWSYELASCLKGAAGSQIWQSGAAMPDRLALLLATNRFASATVIMFALQKRHKKMNRNLLLKLPYKFKNSYGGTPEPQTPQDAPWLRGPSLKSY